MHFLIYIIILLILNIFVICELNNLSKSPFNNSLEGYTELHQAKYNQIISNIKNDKQDKIKKSIILYRY